MLKKIHSMIMWNSVLRYLTQTYLTFAVTTVLAMKSGRENISNYIVCLLSVAYLLIFPLFSFIFLCYHQGDMQILKRSKSKVKPEEH